MNDNLIPIDGGGKPDKMAQALRDLKANIAVHIEYQALGATLTRAKYLALVKEGFTEDQAIALCKSS